MKAPKNRRVFVIDYAVATALGKSFEETWDRAIKGETGFRKVTRCTVESACNVVGEIPDWDPLSLGWVTKKEVYNWNAAFVILTMVLCKEALDRAGIEMDNTLGPRTACLIGSTLNGLDSFRIAARELATRGPLRVSPYLLPNLCANLPSGKAGMLLHFNGPIFSPQGACASGNHSIGIAARMIRDGDCDLALAGGVEMPIMPEIIHGFANMNASIKMNPRDRAYNDHSQASRPFSLDRKGFVLAEGGGVLLLAAEEVAKSHGLVPKAEVLGVGWTSDAYHFTEPNSRTIRRAIFETIDDAGLSSGDIHYINTHGTSTPKGDKTEVESLKEIFGKELSGIPLSSNKSQIGHSLGAAAAIEAALTIEGMHRGIMLPTLNYIPDPQLDGIDVIPEKPRKQNHEIALSNSFGFGGTNCCLIFKGV